MTRQTLMFAGFCFAIGLSVISARAQTGGVQAKIPFNFAVSGTTFPAGEYTIIPKLRLVKIEDMHGNTVAIVLANEISGGSAGVNGRIIFHCYRERCFMAEVWSPVQQNGKQLLVSRTEAGLAKEEHGKYFAVLGEKLRSTRMTVDAARNRENPLPSETN